MPISKNEFKRAFRDAIALEFELVPKIEKEIEFEFSLCFIEKMNRIINSQNKTNFFVLDSVYKKISLVSLVFVTLFSIVLYHYHIHNNIFVLPQSSEIQGVSSNNEDNTLNSNTSSIKENNASKVENEPPEDTESKSESISQKEPTQSTQGDSQVLPINDIEAAKKSDMIIVGKIESISTPYFSSDNDWVQSDVIIKLDEILKGSYESSTITMHQFGGTINGISYSNRTGIVFPSVNTKVIVFLEKSGDEFFIIDNSYIFIEKDGIYEKYNSKKQYTLSRIKELI